MNIVTQIFNEKIVTNIRKLIRGKDHTFNVKFQREQIYGYNPLTIASKVIKISKPTDI